MKLSHFSTTIVTKVQPRTQTEADRHFKPKGFWISVDGEDDWLDWCIKENNFNEIKSQIQHRVILNADANILYLKNKDEIDAFTEKYVGKIVPRYMRYQVSWDEVAKSYQGIIIAPYIWSRRMHEGSEWYYPWDCASGCIWDETAIKEIKVLKKRQKSKKPTSRKAA